MQAAVTHLFGIRNGTKQSVSVAMVNPIARVGWKNCPAFGMVVIFAAIVAQGPNSVRVPAQILVSSGM